MLELAETFAYEAHEYRPASFMPISCIGAVWRRGRWSTMVEGSGVRTPMPKLSFNKKIKISNKEFDGQTERRFADFWPTKNQSKSHLVLWSTCVARFVSGTSVTKIGVTFS